MEDLKSKIQLEKPSFTNNSLTALTEKNLHPRNKHRGRYAFDELIQANPALAKFVQLNAYGDWSIEFANAQAVKALNKALLIQHYNIIDWAIPAQYLCPPIPGRADYVHYLADLVGFSKGNMVAQQANTRVLDIGVGANIIYPLIGQREYGWRFVGADIDTKALANAQRILHANQGLAECIELRLQANSSAIFNGIIQPNDYFNATMCNPPFHASLQEAQAGTQRKLNNLAHHTAINSNKNRAKAHENNNAPKLNFGGQAAELYCEGGELAFLRKMISESMQFKHQCGWFTSLVSKAETLPRVYSALKQANVFQFKTIEMSQGQKKSRIIAWTYMGASQRKGD